jgi:DNA-binding transcriptional regulator YdaS (Cro superfamily)
MKLRDYLHFNHMTAAKFADQLGMNRNHIRGINRGVIKCGIKLANQIEIMTGGQVTVIDLRGEEKEGD